MNNLQLAALGRCADKSSIEDLFTKYNILSNEEKISALIEIMGEPEVSYSREDPTIEEQYNALTGVFLSNIWKPDAV